MNDEIQGLTEAEVSAIAGGGKIDPPVGTMGQSEDNYPHIDNDPPG